MLDYLPGAPLYESRDENARVRQLAEALLQVHSVTPERHDLSWLHVQMRDAMRASIESDWPRVREHSTLASEVNAALAEDIERIELLGPVFTHDDYWPGNTVWFRGKLTGIIDWSDAQLSDPRGDVAQGAIDLTLINDVRVARAFVSAYEALSGQRVRNLWFFTLLRGLHALLSYEFWFTGYQDAKLAYMTKRRIRTRIEALLQRALADRQRGLQ